MQVQHRLIIHHPLQTAILVVDDHGEVRLPAFTSDNHHTAEVDYINAAVQEQFGLLTTVLRSLHHSAPLGDVVVRVHELETHGSNALRSYMVRWCRHAELRTLVNGEDQAAIALWWGDETGPGAVVDGREWTSFLDRLEHAYLAAYAELAPPQRLRTALHMAAPLSFIDMALRYRHQPPSVVRLHPWMRDLVPQTLRLALACLA